MARRLEGNLGLLNPCGAALTTDESAAAFAHGFHRRPPGYGETSRRARGANRENRVGRILNLCFLRLLATCVGVTSLGSP